MHLGFRICIAESKDDQNKSPTVVLLQKEQLGLLLMRHLKIKE